MVQVGHVGVAVHARHVAVRVAVFAVRQQLVVTVVLVFGIIWKRSTPGRTCSPAAVAAVLAAVAAKGKAPEDRTPEEQALLDSAIPFNLDQWDGYEYERDQNVDLSGFFSSTAGKFRHPLTQQLDAELRKRRAELPGRKAQ